jgi:hypothetical protein
MEDQLLFLPLAPKKNQAFLFQPFHFIEFSAAHNPEKKSK